MKIILSAVLTLLPAVVLPAATGDLAGSGHWEGTVQISKKTAKVTVDLARNPNGGWVGALALPEQKLTDVPVSNISIKDGAVLSNRMNRFSPSKRSLRQTANPSRAILSPHSCCTSPPPCACNAYRNPAYRNHAQARRPRRTWRATGKVS